MHLLKNLIFMSSVLVIINQSIAKASTKGIAMNAQFICETLLAKKPFIYSEHFSKTFRDKISQEYMQRILNEVVDSMGKCTNSKVIQEESPQKAQIFISSNRGNDATLDLTLETSDLIDGLSFLNLNLNSNRIDSWEDVRNKLEKLPGKVALTYKSMGEEPSSIVAQNINGELSQPIGSGFKLYVLGALIDDIKSHRFSWTNEYPITESLKSLPSGIMHTWDNGKLVSLFDFASYMIKISDNTATDHLMSLLGRERVEQQLPVMKNNFIVENTPYLLTAEMFKIKWALPQEIIARYISSDPKEKRFILSEQVEKVSLKNIGKNGVDGSKPFLIHEVEWFASTENLCEAMDYIRQSESKEALQILAQNAPFVKIDDSSNFMYAGFKGGSEPGVVTMTYLFQAKNGQWSCLSMAWNDSVNRINQTLFQDIVGKTIGLFSKTKTNLLQIRF